MSMKRDDGLKTYEWGDPAVPCDSRNVAATLSSPSSTLDEFVESLNRRWCAEKSFASSRECWTVFSRFSGSGRLGASTSISNGNSARQAYIRYLISKK